MAEAAEHESNGTKPKRPRLAVQKTTVTIEGGLLDGVTVTWKRSANAKVLRDLDEFYRMFGNATDEELLEAAEEVQATLEANPDAAPDYDKVGEIMAGRVVMATMIVDLLTPQFLDWDLDDEDGVAMPANHDTLDNLDFNLLLELVISFASVVGEIPKVTASA